eukprot:TRINITY_DN36421_c0_g1_i1.p1 TRINITY_DN36421_c0_g1~~TRINITY_DN36421_c0_g1_i1.p1  ORF type:complete len:899 (-),score=203.45 TRINITY_DN36421_c0_g1_i1:217-2913(-)
MSTPLEEKLTEVCPRPGRARSGDSTAGHSESPSDLALSSPAETLPQQVETVAVETSNSEPSCNENKAGVSVDELVSQLRAGVDAVLTKHERALRRRSFSRERSTGALDANGTRKATPRKLDEKRTDDTIGTLSEVDECKQSYAERIMQEYNSTNSSRIRREISFERKREKQEEGRRLKACVGGSPSMMAASLSGGEESQGTSPSLASDGGLHALRSTSGALNASGFGGRERRRSRDKAEEDGHFPVARAESAALGGVGRSDSVAGWTSKAFLGSAESHKEETIAEGALNAGHAFVRKHLHLTARRVSLPMQIMKLRPHETALQKSLKAMIKRFDYEVIRTTLILLDACLVIFDTEFTHEYLSVDPEAHDDFWVSLPMDFFCLLFLLDLIIRVVADNFDLSLRSGSGWRWFNIVTVSGTMLDSMSRVAFWNQRSVSSMRIFAARCKPLRIVRVLSLVQVMSFIRNDESFRELRIMVHSLTGALKSLFWVSSLIFVILLAFAVFITEGVIELHVQSWKFTSDGPVLSEDESAWRSSLDAAFGTVPRSCLSLYKSMSGGADWGDVLSLLTPLSREFTLVFLVFITFAFVAVMNVATAVFVEATMRRSNSDRDMMVQSEMNETRDFLDSMRDVFEELDADKGGDVTKDELQEHLCNPYIGAYFTRLGVDVDNFDKLYSLLDSNNSGTISQDEFIYGCLRLRGQAKALDLEHIVKTISEVYECIEDGLESLSDCMLYTFEERDKELHARLDWLEKRESTRQGTYLEHVGQAVHQSSLQQSRLQEGANARLDRLESVWMPLGKQLDSSLSILAKQVEAVAHTLQSAKTKRAAAKSERRGSRASIVSGDSKDTELKDDKKDCESIEEETQDKDCSVLPNAVASDLPQGHVANPTQAMARKKSFLE